MDSHPLALGDNPGFFRSDLFVLASSVRRLTSSTKAPVPPRKIAKNGQNRSFCFGL